MCISFIPVRHLNAVTGIEPETLYFAFVFGLRKEESIPGPWSLTDQGFSNHRNRQL